MTPRRYGTLVDVFNGNCKAIADADSGVDGAESAFAQDVTDPVRLRIGFSVDEHELGRTVDHRRGIGRWARRRCGWRRRSH